jgi:anhydro-N-acetylmuramic acid kinase
MGFDTGPANTLIDAWTKKHLGTNYDEDGNWAKQGTVDKKLLESLLKHPYFRQEPPKSADISQFSVKWLENFLNLHGDIPAQNVAATIIELSVMSITHAIDHWAPKTQQIVACGGGCFNTYFMERLAGKLLPKQLRMSSDFGIEPEWVEATAFAWLAHQTMHNLPGNSPASTGAKGLRILGGIYQA